MIVLPVIVLPEILGRTILRRTIPGRHWGVGSERTTQLRFRFRFTVRTLAIFVTLVCAYFGAWEATKRYGVPDMRPRAGIVVGLRAPKYGWLEAGSPMPFVTWKEQIGITRTGKLGIGVRREYSFWFFGWGCELFETDIEPLPTFNPVQSPTRLTS